jgi:uncharacterized protein YraI
MKNIQKFLILLCTGMLLSACNMPGAPTPTLDLSVVGTIAAMTLEAYPTSAPVKTRVPPIMTSTPVFTLTPVLTTTITPTYQAPQLSFSGNTNCRKGPGTVYEVTTVVKAGQKATPLGVSQDGNYWLIKNPDGENCWVAKDFAQPAGSMAALPTVMPPPVPSAVPPNAPAWSAYNYTCAFASGGNSLTMNLTWTDRANNEQGYTVYRDEQPIATLGVDANSYVDTAFVATGKSLSYRVEVFSASGRASSSTIKGSCQ